MGNGSLSRGISGQSGKLTSPPPSIEVKNEWNDTSYFPYAFMTYIEKNFVFVLPDYVDEKTKVSQTNTSQHFPNLTRYIFFFEMIFSELISFLK
jgi:hypothetical protein